MNDDPHTRVVRQRRSDRCLLARLVAVIAACVALTSCQSQSSRSISGSTGARADGTSIPPLPMATTPHSDLVYQATDMPCELVDHQLLSRLFGADRGNVTPPLYMKNKLIIVLACNRIYGQGTDATVVPVRVELADPKVVQAQYQRLRDLCKRATVLTEVPRLGESAFTYVDKSIGPQLALYDGNAYLTVGAVPVGGSTRPETQVFPALIQIARNVLTALRT